MKREQGRLGRFFSKVLSNLSPCVRTDMIYGITSSPHLLWFFSDTSTVSTNYLQEEIWNLGRDVRSLNLVLFAIFLLAFV